MAHLFRWPDGGHHLVLDPWIHVLMVLVRIVLLHYTVCSCGTYATFGHTSN